METRKAQLTGGSTYTVSLPKEWATDVDLETGDILHLYPRRDGTVIVEYAGAVAEHWETAVDVGDASEVELRRIIQALYTVGHDYVTLSSPTSLTEASREISMTCRKLIGLEVLESTSERITLRTLLDSGTVSIEQATQQLEQVALSMHEDAVSALTEPDTELVDHVAERDHQADRLHGMITRHFQRSLQSLRETEALDLDQATLYDYHTTSRQLERVADHAEKVALLAERLEGPLPDPFPNRLRTTGDAARTVVERANDSIIRDATVESAHEALDARDEVAEELQELEQALHGRDVADSQIVALAIDSLTRTAEYGGNIAETALQSAARNHEL